MVAQGLPYSFCNAHLTQAGKRAPSSESRERVPPSVTQKESWHTPPSSCRIVQIIADRSRHTGGTLIGNVPTQNSLMLVVTMAAGLHNGENTATANAPAFPCFRHQRWCDPLLGSSVQEF
jgi:hypothetical protein